MMTLNRGRHDGQYQSTAGIFGLVCQLEHCVALTEQFQIISVRVGDQDAPSRHRGSTLHGRHATMKQLHTNRERIGRCVPRLRSICSRICTSVHEIQCQIPRLLLQRVSLSPLVRRVLLVVHAQPRRNIALLALSANAAPCRLSLSPNVPSSPRDATKTSSKNTTD